jgi:hypothetical protein
MDYKTLIENYLKNINSDTSLSPAEKQAKRTAIQNWARHTGAIKTKRNPDGSETFVGWTNMANQDISKAGADTKDTFTKATGLEWGTGEKTTTPQKELEARKSFVNSNPEEVTPEVVAKQENNITKYDQGTAAGQGRNTDAAKQAQAAQRNSRKLVNGVKQDGVADIPVTDDRSDAWYEDGTGEGGEGNGETPTNGNPSETPTNGNPSETTKPEEKEANGNGLLLADILMTGVKNALHYRPAFRTAYGEDIEGRDFGNEKSLAMKLAEENMKRGLERRNSRLDYESQQEAEIEATKKKGKDLEYRQLKQDMTKDLSPVTTTNSFDESSQNLLGGQRKAGSTTTTTWNPIQASR